VSARENRQVLHVIETNDKNKVSARENR